MRCILKKPHHTGFFPLFSKSHNLLILPLFFDILYIPDFVSKVTITFLQTSCNTRCQVFHFNPLYFKCFQIRPLCWAYQAGTSGISQLGSRDGEVVRWAYMWVCYAYQGTPQYAGHRHMYVGRARPKETLSFRVCGVFNHPYRAFSLIFSAFKPLSHFFQQTPTS